MKRKRKLDQDFYEKVLSTVQLIPYGRVTSYGAIARYVGAAKSSRMIGYALKNYAGMMEVPAHRVVNRLGILSGRHHFPKEHSMESRLAAEGIEVKDAMIVKFKELFWDPAEEL